MNSKTIVVKTLATIGGFDVDVRASVTNAWLRRYANDDGTGVIDEYQGVALGDAAFSFTYPDGNYQLWTIALAGGTDPTYRLDFWHGGANKTQWLGDNTLPYLSSTADPLDLTSTHLKIVDASDGDEPTSLAQLDAAIAALGDPYTAAEINAILLGYLNMTSATVQQVQSQVNFRDYIPTIGGLATNLKHAANRQFVENYVTGRLVGITPSAYQQSPNIIRVIPAGVQEDNRVYRTVEAGIAQAHEYNDPLRRMLVSIEGDSASGTPLPNWDLFQYGLAQPYVDITGANEGIKIRLGDGAYTSTNLGENIISRIILDDTQESTDISFTKKTFYNVHFQKSFPGYFGVFAFTSCRFFGCSTNVNGNSYTTCLGVQPLVI